MEAYLAENELDGLIEVDSAGTGAWHVGERADPRMRQAAERRGFRLDSIARCVDPDELCQWDLILAMDSANYEDLRDHDSAECADIRLFSDFLPSDAPRDVPDPYFGGSDGFDRVIDLIEEGCPAIVDHLLDR
jgi:protein-tyrosine phosphatase